MMSLPTQPAPWAAAPLAVAVRPQRAPAERGEHRVRSASHRVRRAPRRSRWAAALVVRERRLSPSRGRPLERKAQALRSP